MAPLPPVADTLRVRLAWKIGDNVNAESIIYFTYEGSPPSAGNCISLATTINGFAHAQLVYLIGNTCYVGLTTVEDIASDTGNSGQAGSLLVGTLDGSMLSANAAQVINHQIGRRYRGGHPRTYLPPATEAQLQTQGTWTTDQVDLVNTNWGTFLDDCIGESAGSTTIETNVAVSYYTGGALRTTPLVEPITGSIARVQVGSQRRRLKGA